MKSVLSHCLQYDSRNVVVDGKGRISEQTVGTLLSDEGSFPLHLPFVWCLYPKQLRAAWVPTVFTICENQSGQFTPSSKDSLALPDLFVYGLTWCLIQPKLLKVMSMQKWASTFFSLQSAPLILVFCFFLAASVPITQTRKSTFFSKIGW